MRQNRIRRPDADIAEGVSLLLFDRSSGKMIDTDHLELLAAYSVIDPGGGED